MRQKIVVFNALKLTNTRKRRRRRRLHSPVTLVEGTVAPEHAAHDTAARTHHNVRRRFIMTWLKRRRSSAGSARATTATRMTTMGKKKKHVQHAVGPVVSAAADR